MVAAAVGLLGVALGGWVGWFGAMRIESQRQRGARYNEALAALFSALGENAEVLRLLSDKSLAPEVRAPLFERLSASRTKYSAAKVMLLTSVDGGDAQRLAEADDLGFDGRHPEVHASAAALVASARRAVRLKPLEDELVVRVLFGAPSTSTSTST